MKRTAVALVAALTATAAFAEFPDKPVNFIVPWPPGDLEDQLTRLIADEVQNRTGLLRPSSTSLAAAGLFLVQLIPRWPRRTGTLLAPS